MPGSSSSRVVPFVRSNPQRQASPSRRGDVDALVRDFLRSDPERQQAILWLASQSALLSACRGESVPSADALQG
jgi:hypothetical protein